MIRSVTTNSPSLLPDNEEWPICTVEGCTEEVNPKRIVVTKHGRCLKHGDLPKQFTVATPYNKGGLQLITHGDIEDIGRK